MNKEILRQTVTRLVAKPKGILAIDESLSTCNKRFEKLGISTTEEKRREYRELLVTAPDIEKYISGYIIFNETIRQKTLTGKNFTDILKLKGMEIGIKVDEGLVDLPDHPGEKFTQGLDGLAERLKEYKNMGATFAKWRVVYSISENTPSDLCMKTNAEILAKYAAICQARDLVPIVEPEVLLEGDHTLEKCYEVSAQNFKILFIELKKFNVFLPGIVLKTSMVISGKNAGDRAPAEKIAEMTVKCLEEHVPKEVRGVVFLSGGQGDEEAVINLNAISKLKSSWHLTFSYGRAIQNPALKSWAKNPEDITGAQKLLVAAARNNSLASVGQYK
ncbi:hypothetical protein A3I95_00120 [Candidatus Nomurabacteria bacterium RIFCSPLOWO2_02_FULL_44_12]|nr:MAG: hypothetical protein A3I95_00120 [Candidatus Nomurabacteria bacterium RIFCSPLOWO2_02_FULL_44_12]